MKSKIISIIVCFILFFNTSITSFADQDSNARFINIPTSVGVIKQLGHVAATTAGLVIDASLVLDYGMYIYNLLTDEQQENLNNTYEDDNFEEVVNETISTLGTIKTNYHFVPYILRSLEDDTDFFGEGGNTLDNFDSHKRTLSIQGIPFEYTLTTSKSSSWGTTWYNAYICYTTPYDDSIYRKTITTRLSYNGTPFIDEGFYVTIDSNNRIEICNTLNGEYKIIDNTAKLYSLQSTCSSCPHDFDFRNPLSNGVLKPNSKDYDYLKENYPNIEFLPVEDSPEEDSPEEDSPEEDSPILELPQFPNLDSFDFSGFDFDKLGDLFKNFTNKFPFSIPFDLYNLISSFSVEPKAPIFEFPIFSENITIDLTAFDELANIIRMFVLICWVFGLFLLSKTFGGD